MKRPLVLFSAAVLSGTLCGLTEVPIIWKAAATLLVVAALITAGLKGRGAKSPLLFYLAAFSVVLFLTGFIRSSFVCRRYLSEEYTAFFEKYEATNPGQFNYALYLKSKGICSKQQLELSKEEHSLLQEAAETVMNDHVASSDAGVFRAMLVGDKSDLEEETKKLYQSSGISHLLAVSGLHVGLAGTLAKITASKFLGLSRFNSSVISGSVVLLYTLMTGASASAVRAAFMFLCSIAAPLIGKGYDSFSAPAASAAILLLYQPYLITQSGFQLSFTAILGILAAGIIIRKNFHENNSSDIWQRIRSKVSKPLISSLCVNIFTLPVIASAYYQIPAYSCFLNLAVIPLMTVIMVSSFGVLLFGMLENIIPGIPLLSGFFRFLSIVSAAPGHYVLKLYEILCNSVNRLPLSTLTIGEPHAVKIIISFLFLYFLLILFKRKKRTEHTILLLFTVFLGLSVFLKHRETDRMYISCLDVGQGDCFHIHSEDRDIIIDCGSSGYEKAGSRILEPYLLSRGITDIDMIIISHADADHTNGIVYLMNEGDAIKADSLVLPIAAVKDEKYDTLKTLAKGNDIDILYAKTGSVFQSRDLTLKCIYSEAAKTDDTNRESDVFLLEAQELKMLFTGDITEKEEQEMLQSYQDSMMLRNITVLKCSHHGSDTANSEAFLDMVNPEYAVLSYGKENRYGHPADQVIERLREKNIEICSTAKNGALKITTDRTKKVRISAY